MADVLRQPCAGAHCGAWRTFFGDCMQDYAYKEDHVGGAHGVEVRFVLLDTELVDAFLALDASLKNAAYKHWLVAYLRRARYPLAERYTAWWSGDVKRGFTSRGYTRSA
eukprot:CAMPEP_0198314554 /NCGR_PEP_ID=MMETSP1450-20131203/5146_1 /TAXON_ID=753684 ORGANISM="Madagascaria erythrocladiodes, Strain CCMP3234" /NCGR_SAMPLE_ID=MMETSP1450 /ASSEMBLY_ACC=CAM_ASM_001115 /LENGTH=108 /DNA_ID=CAMNT_0044017607 /DNA_START=48 /DNA_END=371 /DNA_ORIENTATION=+